MRASTTSRPSASCTSSAQPGAAHHGRGLGRQSVDQPVGGQHPARGMGKPRHRRARNADERAHHVSGRPARRSHHPPALRRRRKGARSLRREVRRLVPARRPDQGRAPSPVHALRRRQLHRVHAGHALSADRRAQIRQAGARPRDHLRHRSLRRAQGRAGLGRFDHALESQRRPAARPARSRAATPAMPSSTTGSSPASPTSTTCASAGRRRCGPLTPASRARPTGPPVDRPRWSRRRSPTSSPASARSS